MSETAAAGYSGTPLPKKLGMKAGQAAAFIALPKELAALPGAEAFGRADRYGAAAELGPEDPYDLIIAFYDHEGLMGPDLGCLKGCIVANGAIWLCWPKRASKVATDITEDAVRRAALAHGLVDVKVCAVSEVWSGLKLVVPVKARGG